MHTRQAEVSGAGSDEEAIRGVVDKWLIASEEGDLPTMLNLLADEVIFMVPNKKPFGKEVFAQNYQQTKGAKLMAESHIQEIKVVGDWAWMRNFLRVTFTDANEESSRYAGHVLTILQKGPDGNWVIARDANLLMPERPGS